MRRGEGAAVMRINHLKATNAAHERNLALLTHSLSAQHELLADVGARMAALSKMLPKNPRELAESRVDIGGRARGPFDASAAESWLAAFEHGKWSEESGANDARGSSTSIRKADAFLVEADACITSQPGEGRGTPGGGNFVVEAWWILLKT